MNSPLPAVTNRVHFLDEQRRHRRTARVMAALVTVALIVSGIPLSVLVSPALVLLGVIATYIADVFTTVPPALWKALREAVFILPETWRAIWSDSIDIPWRTLTLLLVVPGTVVIFIIWTLVRVLSRNTGVGGMMRSLGARAPDGTDLKERQLVNLVEEISVAAGITPPRVLLVDSDAMNAAAIGLRVDDATVIVSKGFLKSLRRDEGQAIIAHLIGSVGNGDLRIASAILSALQTWGVVTLMLDSPFGARARQSLGLFARQAVDSARGRLDPRNAELTLDLLLFGSEAGHVELYAYLDQIESGRDMMHPIAELFIKVPLLLTMGLASIAARAVIWTFTLLVSGPWIGALWRTRRRLADATAVELTRNPTALASAVRSLAAGDVRIPGAETVDFLFPVWKKDEERDAARTDIGSTLVRMQLNHDKRLAAIARLGAFDAAGTASSTAMEGAPQTPSEPITQTIRDILRFAMLIVGVTLLIGVLLALDLVAMSGVMMLVWWLLEKVFVSLPAFLSDVLHDR